jgi:hypothetical protein
MYETLSSWLMPLTCIVMGIAVFFRFVHNDERRVQDITFNILLSAALLFFVGALMDAQPLATDGFYLSYAGRVLYLIFLGIVGTFASAFCWTIVILIGGMMFAVCDFRRKKKRIARATRN